MPLPTTKTLVASTGKRFVFGLVVLCIAATLLAFALPSSSSPDTSSIRRNGDDDDFASSTIAVTAGAPEIRPALGHTAEFPYRLNGTHFEVIRNSSTTPVEWYTSAAMDAQGFIVFPAGVDKVFIEVGTNDEPELGPLLRIHPNAALIGFEPQPGVFTDMLKKFPTKQRLVTFPAAITPHEGFVPMFVSAHKGCSSLLSMNDRARHFAKKEGKRAPRKSGVIQLRTLEYCASVDQQINVPSFPLRTVLSKIPPHVSIDLLMIDAQGFDIVVASTIGSAGSRAKFVVLECQDLDPGHLLFLVQGAPSCHQQKQCFEAAMPHRLEYCWDNAPKVREYNCLYRRPDVSIDDLPKGVKIVSQPRVIHYPTTVPYKCPAFDTQ
jgi:FkbM family methyltransferase